MMRKYSYIACALSILLWSAPRAEAQLADPGAGGIAMGHLHLTVPDVEEGRHFWHAFGGTSVMNGRLELIQIPGVFVMLREAETTGGSVVPSFRAVPRRRVHRTVRHRLFTDRWSRDRVGRLLVVEPPDSPLRGIRHP